MHSISASLDKFTQAHSNYIIPYWAAIIKLIFYKLIGNIFYHFLVSVFLKQIKKNPTLNGVHPKSLGSFFFCPARKFKPLAKFSSLALGGGGGN